MGDVRCKTLKYYLNNKHTHTYILNFWMVGWLDGWMGLDGWMVGWLDMI